ncbi:hypothetical protein ACFO8O_15675 [Hephaestia sp. GCM10023244]|uniref:hypothetical protein n=1 Tax=unclassified Hephaestia TaxID=2631281 RepID=UPI002076FA9D|nr:hypothetical protein [Hephaestia sp. MAHUQ-44]MCM8732403.1 hypothetical protein [Hephaestia sp. MAHUQ-44]
MSITHLRRAHNRRHHVAGAIVEHLTAFESDLGRALASGSRLIGFLPDARTQADVSAVVGQEAISHFVTSLGLISDAMAQVVDGHHSLDRTRQFFGIPLEAGGDKDTIPSLRGEARAKEGGSLQPAVVDGRPLNVDRMA